MDVLSYVFGGGLTALNFRRGWTHGALALVVLPFALTGLVLLWDRVVGRRKSLASTPPLLAGQITLLAVIAILSHPLLDFMNTYGMRWLMPFENRWFYGDALFIVDPWVWGALVVGVVLARRGKRRYAVGALAVVGVYAALMLASSQIERRLIPGERVMVSPVPLNPFRRTVVIDAGDRYRLGAVNWLRRPVFSLDANEVLKHDELPAAQRAAGTPEGRVFLRWARFPFFVGNRPASGAHRGCALPTGSWRWRIWGGDDSILNYFTQVTYPDSFAITAVPSDVNPIRRGAPPTWMVRTTVRVSLSTTFTSPANVSVT